MAVLWMESWWEVLLTTAVILSTALTFVLVTLPSRYSSFDHLEKATGDVSKDANSRAESAVTVQVVVLGDIGRSPRMQYHALSIANHGGKVNLIGFVESEVHPDVQASRSIKVKPLHPFSKRWQTNNKALFLLIAPLKVLWQVWTLYQALGYRTRPSKWMLVQNPPSIPTLAVAQLICFLRNTRLIIDWHNFGYSLLALRLGPQHPLVRVSEWYEGFFAQRATAHFAVTDAMTKLLKQKWDVDASPLHDRPAEQFQPLTTQQRTSFLSKLAETAQYADGLETGKWKLLVSSTSWTADEDFALLLDALVGYSAAVAEDSNLPRALVIITGKGPLKEYYLKRIRELNQENKLSSVVVTTAWLSTEDYASLLGSADVGISLHTSSSGVDLPMKVVDMLGTGLPVLGWSKFEAWPELIHEGDNGCGFESAEGMTILLKDLFGDGGQRLQRLRQGALKDCERRWDDEWMPVAGQLLQLKP
ncbi:mannosyltransferase [Saxophila tyrrhenica]|uniref:Chitobiosyldiphosphodolichol beta-mannosyltransferase n=1 Tax=Saxophila tyrrhenica TaxID=1690608 RepID=A0AAV9PAI5_9PEZI|nr:mannosyltransferase [Saxophila tyrrhenica]